MSQYQFPEISIYISWHAFNKHLNSNDPKYMLMAQIQIPFIN